MIANTEPELAGWGSKRWVYTSEERDNLKLLHANYKESGKPGWHLLADVLDLNMFTHPSTDAHFICGLLDRIEKGEE